MCKCEIQWVKNGSPEPTPDENEAIAYAICFSGEPKAFPICEEHARRTPREGWMLLFLPETTPEKLAAALAEVRVVVKAIEDAFKDAPKILPTLRKASDHYSFSRWGMYVGVEPDGYIHT